MNLSYVHGVGTTPLLADTIGGALNRAAERWGDCDALVACHQQFRYSYRELRDEADRAARALIALGVQRGDRVGIWSGNRAEWMITQSAAAKAGAILFAAESATRAALDAIQCLGGNGYVNEYPAGRLLRDAKLYEIGAGTSEIRRMIIGRDLVQGR